jgi:hypothetical protein
MAGTAGQRSDAIKTPWSPLPTLRSIFQRVSGCAGLHAPGVKVESRIRPVFIIVHECAPPYIEISDGPRKLAFSDKSYHLNPINMKNPRNMKPVHTIS